MATAVTIVSSGGLPVTNIDTAGALGVPLTPVAAGGVPITLVSSGGLPATLVNETGSLFFGLGGIQPLHYWDFTTNRAILNGQDVGPVTSTTGWSFTRATVANYHNSDGSLTSFASGTPRLGSRGLMLEAARTNLFLNSDTGGTQGVTVTAAAHTLSFYGTGTITLSGASTAGPLVGTGASNRVSLNFTPSAGTLTCTVSGTCTNVQLELGTGASSYIATGGASVQRNADLPIITLSDSAYPLAMWVEIERFADLGAIETAMTVDNNSGVGTERVSLRVNATDLASAVMLSGGTQVADITPAGATTTGVVYKIAGRFALNNVQAAQGGTLGTADTSAALPVGSPVSLRWGSRADGTQPFFGYIRRAAVFNSALSDANLQTITT